MKISVLKKIDLSKIYKAMTGVLTTVLVISANSTTCHIINQPEEPKEIERFKFIK